MTKHLVFLAASFSCFAVFGLSIAHQMGIIGRIENPDGNDSKKLNTLDYINHFPITPTESKLLGVTRFEQGSAAVGINVYAPVGSNSAQLLDMNGICVHLLVDKRKGCNGNWAFAKPYIDSQFLVLAMNTCSPLFLIDWHSNVIWESDLPYHHDMSFDAHGNIYALARYPLHDARISSMELMDDQLVILSPDGYVKKQLSFASLFAKDPALLKIIYETGFEEDNTMVIVGREKAGYEPDDIVWDVFHSNTLEYIHRDRVGQMSNCSFRAGNVLFCSRHLNLIGVIDVEAEKVVWHWGPGELDGPHVPRLLDNGHILVFDNGSRRGKSRIIEMDPDSGRIVRTIGDNEPTAFFSRENGGLQRLPNGNTQITESQGGRVFEVTPNDCVVWEFYTTPFREKTWKRPVVYRMPRIVDFEQFPELRTR